MRSISSASTHATLYASASAQIRSNSASRRLGDSFLESFSPSSTSPGGRITAAAYTGPASGPAPASSTPHTRRYPAEKHRSSMLHGCSSSGMVRLLRRLQ